jgi:hypothetical protein
MAASAKGKHIVATGTTVCCIVCRVLGTYGSNMTSAERDGATLN